MICMFYLTGEVIDDKITTQCNGEDRYMSNLIKQIIASILESLKVSDEYDYVHDLQGTSN